MRIVLLEILAGAFAIAGVAVAILLAVIVAVWGAP
jgi:hypothetical protein